MLVDASKLIRMKISKTIKNQSILFEILFARCSGTKKAPIYLAHILSKWLLAFECVCAQVCANDLAFSFMQLQNVDVEFLLPMHAAILFQSHAILFIMDGGESNISPRKSNFRKQCAISV